MEGQKSAVRRFSLIGLPDTIKAACFGRAQDDSLAEDVCNGSILRMRTGPVCRNTLHSFAAQFVRTWLFAALLLMVVPASQKLFAADSTAVTPPSPEHIHRLIEALGDADYFVRQKAEADLAKIGFDALEALTAASEHDDMEIVARANRLLSRDPQQLVRLRASPLRFRNCWRITKRRTTNSREARIARLIDLSENQGIPAVCRVICYERSLLVAKTAAVRLLEAKAGDAVNSGLAATSEKGLDGCRGPRHAGFLPGCRPGKIRKPWPESGPDSPPRKKGCCSGSRATPPCPSSRACCGSRSRPCGRSIAARMRLSALSDLIKLRRGEPEELVQLLNWLIDQKDWPATRLVEKRCAATIAESADLLYLVGRGPGSPRRCGRRGTIGRPGPETQSRQRRAVAGDAFSGGREPRTARPFRLGHEGMGARDPQCPAAFPGRHRRRTQPGRTVP